MFNSCKTDELNKSTSFTKTPTKTASGFDSRDPGIHRFGCNKSHSLNRFYEPSYEDKCELRNRDDQKYVNTTQRSYEPRFHDKREFRNHDDKDYVNTTQNSYEQRFHDRRAFRNYNDFVNTTPRFHDLSLDRCELLDRDISQRSHSDNSPFERKDRILKEKEPDKIVGISTDWQYCIISFEQVADLNNWNEHERAQQLIMCLKGNAQKLLSKCTRTYLQNYQRLKNVLGRRFNPVERADWP